MGERAGKGGDGVLVWADLLRQAPSGATVGCKGGGWAERHVIMRHGMVQAITPRATRQGYSDFEDPLASLTVEQARQEV